MWWASVAHPACLVQTVLFRSDAGSIKKWPTIDFPLHTSTDILQQLGLCAPVAQAALSGGLSPAAERSHTLAGYAEMHIQAKGPQGTCRCLTMGLWWQKQCPWQQWQRQETRKQWSAQQWRQRPRWCSRWIATQMPRCCWELRLLCRVLLLPAAAAAAAAADCLGMFLGCCCCCVVLLWWWWRWVLRSWWWQR